MTNATLLVLFGKDDSVEKFKTLQNKIFDEGETKEVKLENLNKQLTFILHELDLPDNTNIFLPIYRYDVSQLDYVLDETRDFDGLKVKFVVIDNGSEEDRDDIMELVNRIEDLTSRNQDRLNSGADNGMVAETIRKYEDSNTMFMDLESLDYFIDLVMKTYKSQKISDGHVPNSIAGKIEDIFGKTAEKFKRMMK